MSFLKRYRASLLLFLASASLLVGGTVMIRALETPETAVFPADGRLALDYISGNRAYSVRLVRPGDATVTLRFTIAPSSMRSR